MTFLFLDFVYSTERDSERRNTSMGEVGREKAIGRSSVETIQTESKIKNTGVGEAQNIK